jgi:hypothetical protein
LGRIETTDDAEAGAIATGVDVASGKSAIVEQRGEPLAALAAYQLLNQEVEGTDAKKGDSVSVMLREQLTV